MLLLPQDVYPTIQGRPQGKATPGSQTRSSIMAPPAARSGGIPVESSMPQPECARPQGASQPCSTSSQADQELPSVTSSHSSRPVSAATTDSSLQGAEDACSSGPHALDVLAALASLGVSEHLRSAVQQALDQIDEATACAQEHTSQDPSTSKPSDPSYKHKGGAPGQTVHTGRAAQPKKAEQQLQQVQSLEQKLSMSRSIMRKLYHRNVELEKELQMLKVNTSPIAFSITTEEVLKQRQAAIQAAGRGQPSSQADDLLMQAFKERDTTVLQLQQALDAARRRCALLESQVVTQVTKQGGSKHSEHKLHDVQAQSQLYHTKYRQIRDDYNRLLNKRAGTLQSNRAASSAAKQLVADLHTRLQEEVSEREAEAALYSAKLYETECKMSDWYVERRMLEEKLSKLSAEMLQRDAVDAEIEGCVCGLLERLKVLEATNQQLRGKLGLSADDDLVQ